MKKLLTKIRSVDTSSWSHTLLGSLSILMILGSLVYYAYKITPILSYIVFSIALIPLVVLRPRFQTLKEKLHPLTILITLLDLSLLYNLYQHQTYDLAASPWTELGPLFFLVYTVTTIILFFNYKINTSQKQNIFLTSLHFFIGLSVAALIYPLGYGFDAFIHRVTENWIQLHGFIAPKQPYYIGQYSLVVILSNITHLKIFLIDVWLVPALAALTIPTVVIKSLKKIIPSEFLSNISFWIFACVPFLLLPLTTPHNLVLLLSILVVFLNFSRLHTHGSFSLSFLLSTAALFTHPLIGAPIFIFTLATFFVHKFEKNKKISITLLALTFVTLCLLLPAMFTLNGLRIGGHIPTLSNPFTHITTFLDLFKRPYWYAATSPLRFELLYLFERFLVPAVLLLALFGFTQYKKQNTSLLLWIFPLTTLGLFIDAWLLRSWIVFPDVVAYEQGDYPMRLIHTSIIFLLPFAMYGFSQLYHWLLSLRVKRSNLPINLFIITIIPVILTLALYLSYPQRNVKARFPGYNVTASDFTAAEWIHAQNSEYNYVVLSDQLVSAAALTKYSFAKYFDTPQGQLFYYSIPTGGEMYKYYGKMIYEGQKREYMESAMQTVGVEKAYFVVNKYWANAEKIIAGAKQTADAVEVIDDNVWIFEYNKK